MVILSILCVPQFKKIMIILIVVRRCSVRKVFLEISQNSWKNTRATVCFLIKLQPSGCIKKETLARVFSCQFCEISKNTFFKRIPLVAASRIET